MAKTAVIVKCNHGHEFVTLTDHPTTNGIPDCPHCMKVMIIQFESYVKLVEEKDKS